MRFADKVALITGAGSGIGRETALYLAEQGAAVAINDLKTGAAEETAAAIRAKGGKAEVFVADVADAAAVEAMIAAVVEKLGTVDILVNSAGVASVAPVSEITDEEWRRVRAVNLDGTFFCTREALKVMIPKGCGKVVNLSSVAGMTGTANMAAYSAAKAGIFSFTASVGREVIGKGINVNAVAPGMVATPLLASVQAAGAQYGPPPPIRRAAQPREIATLIAFLASDEASYLAGETINVNGGGLVK